MYSNAMLKLFVIIISVCIGVESNLILQKILALTLHLNYPENCEQFNDEILAKAKLDTAQLIASNGYPVENYTVETSDGYLLDIHRIPCGKNCDTSKNDTSRIPVLIMPGLVCSSAVWVGNSQNSLGFILANEGFDVWMGNFRPNSAHKKYTHKNEEFWDYTSDDYGLKDLPATIDYVLRAISFKKILYISISQGTTAIFQLLSTSTEYNDKIAGFVALNPVGGYAYMTVPVLYMIKHYPISWNVIPFVAGRQITALKKHLFLFLCPPSNAYLCLYVLGFFVGLDTQYFNQTLIPGFLHQCSYSHSAKTGLQLAQSMYSRKFRKFDYGNKKNLKLYGTEHPPEYPLEKITTQAALFSTPNDPMGDPLDVAILNRRLPNVVHEETIPIALLNHLELMYLPRGKEIVYYNMVRVLRKMWYSYTEEHD